MGCLASLHGHIEIKMADVQDNSWSEKEGKVFEEKLISAIFVRPYIYDKSDPLHSKRALNAKAWAEIAVVVGKTGKHPPIKLYMGGKSRQGKCT